MRKEDLLLKKSETAKNIQWYVLNVLTDKDLKAFSIPQLEKMIDLMERLGHLRGYYYTITFFEIQDL